MISCCLFSGDIYRSFGISISFLCVFECNSFAAFCEDFFERYVFILAMLFPVKSPATHAVFWIILFEGAFIVSVADFLAL